VTRLIELIQQLDLLDVDGTIFAAEPWSNASEAIVALEPGSGGMPAEAGRRGLKYFLEVSIAREVLDGWIANLGVQPSLSQKCARLITYAANDA
jgi:hypothetical protein